MKNYDKSVRINHNLNWLYIPNHLYRILIIGGSGPIKTNVLLNIIKHQRPDFDNFFFFTSRIHSNQSINYLSTGEKK